MAESKLPMAGIVIRAYFIAFEQILVEHVVGWVLLGLESVDVGKVARVGLLEVE